MEWLPKLVDLVIGSLQVLTVVFLAYGAYLAIRTTDGPSLLREPALRSAACEKRLAIGNTPAPPRERRTHIREADRRAKRIGARPTGARA